MKSPAHVAQSAKPCPGRFKIASVYNEPSLVFLAGTNTQLLNEGHDIAEAMKKDACVIGVISSDKEAAFLDDFGGDKPSSIGTIEGIDSGRGRPAQLTLYLLPAKKP